MFLIDDLLFAPAKGMLWVFEQVRDAVEEERAGEADAITETLRQLYMQLEQGVITEEMFDAEERRLLDRLDVLQAEADGTTDAGDDEESEEADETAAAGDDDESADAAAETDESA